MSFDYKQVQGPRPDSSGSFLIGLFFGFLLGLGIAAGIAIYFFKTPIPFADRPRTQDKPLATDQKAIEPAAKSAKAEDKPRFDFYRILPGKEEPVTERQIREAAKQAPKPGAPKESYFLQAGSFPNPADADSLKAKLALMGMEANVEPANIAGKGTWYRVRLGPYTRVDEINRIRQQLTQNGIEVSLVKVTDTATN
ncbi:MAG TPA: SPOR domain-containing protein [Burkholderiales bacterium]|nr:SPOR domain-containing protein [Burkholderiales bacterium]